MRVVADSHLRTLLTVPLVATAREVPTWIAPAKGPTRIAAAP